MNLNGLAGGGGGRVSTQNAAASRAFGKVSGGAVHEVHESGAQSAALLPCESCPVPYQLHRFCMCLQLAFMMVAVRMKLQ